MALAESRPLAEAGAFANAAAALATTVLGAQAGLPRRELLFEHRFQFFSLSVSSLPPGCALDVQTGGEPDWIGDVRITMVMVLWYLLPFRIGWAYHLFMPKRDTPHGTQGRLFAAGGAVVLEAVLMPS